MLAAVPAGRRVLVLLEDRLREFDPERETWREIRTAGSSRIAPFLAMCPGSAGELYITGEHGLAKLHIVSVMAVSSSGRRSTATRIASGTSITPCRVPANCSRRAVSTRRSAARDRAMVGKGTGIRVRRRRGRSARLARRRRQHLDRGRIGDFPAAGRTKIPGGKDRRPDRYHLRRLFGGKATPSGSPHRKALTRYTPPLWRRPAGTEEFDLPVSSIAEDRQGRLWMSATDYVLELIGRQVDAPRVTRRFPHPYGPDE